MRFIIIVITAIVLLSSPLYTAQNINAATITKQEVQKQKKKKIKQRKKKGLKIVKTASKYVGKLPYCSGGASLVTGSDCCGFTMRIYAKCKITIGRTVYAQACQGKSVSLKKAWPGDIVIYYGHVGIYAGKGKVIHCPQPGEYVKYSSIFIMPIYDIRRII